MIGGRRSMFWGDIDVLIASSLGDHTVRAAQAGEARIEEIRIEAGGSSKSIARARTSLPQLVFVLHGSIHMRHRGSPLHIPESSWSIVASQCSLAAPSGTHAIVVTLPQLRQTSARATVHSASTGMGRILLDLSRSTLDVTAQLNEPARTEIGNSLTELARLALRDDAGQQPRPPRRAVMCERIKTFVRRHLHQSNLSIDYIAQSFHCTKRYLHKVFGESGCSLNQFIWSLRLERCAHDLADAGFGDRSVTEIAFSWGFSNTSHFSRTFRQRFGMPPSAYRTALLAGDGRRLELARDVRNPYAAWTMAG